jgi:hypothetical protein
VLAPLLFAQAKMRFTSPLALSLLAGTLSNALPAAQEVPSATVSAAPSSVTFTDASTDTAVASSQLDELAAYAQQRVSSTFSESNKKRGSCNLSNVAVRREWNALSKKERKSYTDAVLCLQKKQSKTPASLIPGARSRFDDWVGTHINQTNNIHYTGTFLGCESVTSVCLSISDSDSFCRAPLLHLAVRASTSQRMRLQGIPAILELGTDSSEWS